jgi:hypothetical protein
VFGLVILHFLFGLLYVLHYNTETNKAQYIGKKGDDKK